MRIPAARKRCRRRQSAASPPKSVCTVYEVIAKGELEICFVASFGNFATDALKPAEPVCHTPIAQQSRVQILVPNYQFNLNTSLPSMYTMSNPLPESHEINISGISSKVARRPMLFDNSVNFALSGNIDLHAWSFSNESIIGCHAPWIQLKEQGVTRKWVKRHINCSHVFSNKNGSLSSTAQKTACLLQFGFIQIVGDAFIKVFPNVCGLQWYPFFSHG